MSASDNPVESNPKFSINSEQKSSFEELNFLKEIRKARDEGLGCIPLIGAGLSAPSGVPIIHELHGYLIKCISMAFGLNLRSATYKHGNNELRINFEKIREQKKFRWLPGRDDWPPFAVPQSTKSKPDEFEEDLVEWSLKLKAALDQAIESKKNGVSETSELDILQEGYGASAEWRSALLFLSRLNYDEEESKLTLNHPDYDIIDTFFLRVVSQKKSTLGHVMLALLTGPLRITTVLTTNFDTLVEHAFEQTFNELTVFDVHLESGLPSYRDMQGLNCLVKLHGGRYGLRADYSLDQPPSDDDMRHFCSYLADQYISTDRWKEAIRNSDSNSKSISAARYLFVIGSSAKDKRILSLIANAAEVLTNFKVFWICGRAKSVEDTKNKLKIILEKKPPSIDQITYEVINHQYPGLLFLELFQIITRGLPPRGCIPPSPPRVPVPPETSLAVSLKSNRDPNYEQDLRNELEEAINLCFHKKNDSDNLKFIIVHGERDTTFGATTIAADIFAKEIDGPRQAVWIDLDEIRDCNSLFEVLVHTISRKAGIITWIPVLLLREHSDRQRIEDAQIHEISRLTNSPDCEWVIFLNARSGAGNVLSEYEYDYANGWLDKTESDEPKSEYAESDNSFGFTANGDSFRNLIQRLCKKECPNVTVVLLCYDGPFVSRITGHENINYDYPHNLSDSRIININEYELSETEHSKNTYLIDQKDIVKKAIEWIDDDSSKLRFLFCLCLVNRLRYPSMVWSWPFNKGQDTTEKWSYQADEWIEELQKRQVLRRKKGGFIWMHCDIRNLLRKDLLKNNQILDDDLSSIHDGLAKWYHRLFAASDDPITAFEIIYHRINEATALIKRNDIGEANQSVLRIFTCLGDITRVLEVARPAILSWGFSKGICHELYVLREIHLKILLNELESNRKFIQNNFNKVRDIIFRIWETSLRMNRDLAREVGENTIAIKRHHQLRIAQYARTHNPDKFVVTVSDYQNMLMSSDPIERAKCLNYVLNPRGIGLGSHELLSEWISSWNELSILGIAIRSYSFSSKCFDMIYKRLKFPSSILKSSTSLYDESEKIIELDKWINYLSKDNNIKKSNQFQAVIGRGIKTLQREQQLALAVGQSYLVISAHDEAIGKISDFHDKAAKSFNRASRAFQAARILQKHVGESVWPLPLSVRSLDKYNVSEWYEDRQRLLTQEGLAVAFNKEKDYRKAHRRLNEAEAALSQTRHSRGAMEQAIIELHRSEVLIQEALFVIRNEKGAASTLGEYQSDIIKEIIGHETPNFEQLCANCKKYSKSPKELQSSLLSLEDGWQSLDRANEMLKVNRKNVWWTTWYYEIRIKLIEVMIFAKLSSITQNNKIEYSVDNDLPYICFSYAPYGMPTLADRILEDAHRVVRLDLFRYGRILNSYANITVAFALWRRFTSKKSENASLSKEVEENSLAFRQKNMIQNLNAGIEGLDARNDRRKYLDDMHKSTRLDNHVDDTVSLLKKYVEKINMLLSPKD